MSQNLPTLLDVAIGLIFIFFVFSLFVSGLVELVSSLLEQRAELLRTAIYDLLGKSLADAFFVHKLTSVKQKFFWGFNKPINYLSANSFSTVLIDVLTRPKGKFRSAQTDTFAALQKLAETDPKTVDLLAPLLAKSENMRDFTEKLETWYNSYMEQVSGWYKRSVQGFIWGISLLVAIGMNVDAIHIATRLSADGELREQLLSQAIETTKAGPAALSKNDTTFISSLTVNHVELLNAQKTALKDTLTAREKLTVQLAYNQFINQSIAELGLPIGFAHPLNWKASWPKALLGCVLTAAALSFGAPFWFDLLLKLVNIRNTARRPAGNTPPSNS